VSGFWPSFFFTNAQKDPNGKGKLKTMFRSAGVEEIPISYNTRFAKYYVSREMLACPGGIPQHLFSAAVL
jgi:hypothetical protein